MYNTTPTIILKPTKSEKWSGVSAAFQLSSRHVRGPYHRFTQKMRLWHVKMMIFLGGFRVIVVVSVVLDGFVSLCILLLPCFASRFIVFSVSYSSIQISMTSPPPPSLYLYLYHPLFLHPSVCPRQRCWQEVKVSLTVPSNPAFLLAVNFNKHHLCSWLHHTHTHMQFNRFTMLWQEVRKSKCPINNFTV